MRSSSFRKVKSLPHEEFECFMVARHIRLESIRRLKICCGIAGLGGLGSVVAIALARVGVGKLILVDFDVVEPSNLNRQQYFVHQIECQAEALRKNIADINPYVKQRSIRRDWTEKTWRESLKRHRWWLRP